MKGETIGQEAAQGDNGPMTKMIDLLKDMMKRLGEGRDEEEEGHPREKETRGGMQQEDEEWQGNTTSARDEWIQHRRQAYDTAREKLEKERETEQNLQRLQRNRIVGLEKTSARKG